MAPDRHDGRTDMEKTIYPFALAGDNKTDEVDKRRGRKKMLRN